MGLHEPRQIFFYRHYFRDFFFSLKPDVQSKVNWTLQLISTLDRVPSKFFEHIAGSKGLYAIRIEYNSEIYRVFSFFDEGNIIVLVNGFQKKSQKTPKGEIELAERIKKQYLDEKEQ